MSGFRPRLQAGHSWRKIPVTRSLQAVSRQVQYRLVKMPATGALKAYRAATFDSPSVVRCNAPTSIKSCDSMAGLGNLASGNWTRQGQRCRCPLPALATGYGIASRKRRTTLQRSMSMDFDGGSGSILIPGGEGWHISAIAMGMRGAYGDGVPLVSS